MPKPFPIGNDQFREMFPNLRRSNQRLSDEEIRHIMENSGYGVLSVQGEDGYPYGVPLNYVYDGEFIYFHCAKSGHKLDGIRRCDKVSFCVVGEDQVIPEEFTTAYTSVIVFGRAQVVNDHEERVKVFHMLIDKFSPGFQEEGQAAIEKYTAAADIVRLQIEHIDGKCGSQWRKKM